MYILRPSPRSEKKLRVTTPTGKNIDFGATGYSDYTLHQDSARKDRYISRHEPREDWAVSGINTAGFWSRWILWNLPNFMESVKDTEKRFGITITVRNSNDNNNNPSVILENLSDKDLVDHCNKYPLYDKCGDEDFWYRELVKRYFEKHGNGNVMIRKPKNYSWKQYFALWVDQDILLT
jgi:hypothetical protein